MIDGIKNLSEFAGVLGSLARAGVDGLVQPYVTADARDSDNYIVYLEQSGIGLPDESYYREDSYAEIREAYLAHIARLAGIAGVGEGPFAKTVMLVETRIAAQHWDVVSTRDALKTYNKKSYDELRALLPEFDWGAWLAGLGAPEDRSRTSWCPNRPSWKGSPRPCRSYRSANGRPG